jgi:hypothetical protein
MAFGHAGRPWRLTQEIHMRPLSVLPDPTDSGMASRCHSLISLAIAILAIGAAAVLCFASYLDAEQGMQDMNAAARVPVVRAGSR